MSESTGIEWTDATWNPIRARLPEEIKLHQHKGMKILPASTWGYHCEHVSPGCVNCYAEAMNKRTLPAWGTGLAYNVPNRQRVEIFLDEDELTAPLRWKKPRRVFPCSMTDWCADFVPDEFRDRMLAVCALTPQHSYQFLTKRAEQMREYLTNGGNEDDESMRNRMDEAAARYFEACHANMNPPGRWPLPNVWLGVSCEDQPTADARIPHLLQTPAAVRFISAEPLLGPVDLRDEWLTLGCRPTMDLPPGAGKLDWVIVGGESGPGARPMHPAWVRSIQWQCAAAGVAFFFKQGSQANWNTFKEFATFPTDLQIREFPKNAHVVDFSAHPKGANACE